MSTSPWVVTQLNTILKHQLTGINQYFLHARILKHQGKMKPADYEYKKSIDQMKHADMLVERVLSSGGLPNLQELGALFIGETVDNILACDLKLASIAHKDIETAITACETKEDHVTADILHKILDSEEEHINFIQTQLRLIESMGLSNYLQTQV